MKKLSAILSLLLIVGLFHQGVVLATMATMEKKPAKMNFTPKKKHVMAAAATTPAPAPVTSPAASPSPEASPKA